jgi:hypothetical protein
MVGIGESALRGLGGTYASLSFLGALLFLAAPLVAPNVSAALAAGAIANGGAAAAFLIAQSRNRATVLAGKPSGARPRPEVFVVGVFLSVAIVVALYASDRLLAHSAADRFALAMTLLQAAVALPLQVLVLLQPDIVADPERAKKILRLLLDLAIVPTAIVLIGIGAAAMTSVSHWIVAAVVVASTPFYCIGLLGATTLLIARRTNPWLMTAAPMALVVLTLLPLRGSHPSETFVAALWFGSVCATGSIQLVMARSMDNLRVVLAFSTIAIGSIALGVETTPLLLIVLALVVIATRRSQIIASAEEAAHLMARRAG